MNKESIFTGIAGIVIGAAGMAFIASQATAQNNTTPKQTNTAGSGQHVSNSHEDMSMAAMTERLKNKKGDDFDKAFTEEMIAHHQGAIDMAALIPERAKHDELKKLGGVIASTQTKDINDMRNWRMVWGYANSPQQ